MEQFKVIIVEDARLELKGTEEIFRTEIPEAQIIGTASCEEELWPLLAAETPCLLLLDLGLEGSTTAGVSLCRKVGQQYPEIRILIFTGEILNEKLWVDALEAGADGIVLKCGELLTRTDVIQVVQGRRNVFNQPVLEKIVHYFVKTVRADYNKNEAFFNYDIDEYDERLLRHLALGYTKEMITNLRGMPFGIKSLEKRQNELIGKLFAEHERNGVNATRLVVRALELRILDIENLVPDES